MGVGCVIDVNTAAPGIAGLDGEVRVEAASAAATAGANVAVTFLAAVMLRVQPPRPQSPDQPTKTEPGAGWAVSVTTVSHGEAPRRADHEGCRVGTGVRAGGVGGHGPELYRYRYAARLPTCPLGKPVTVSSSVTR